jgi:hypothetical protein
MFPNVPLAFPHVPEQATEIAGEQELATAALDLRPRCWGLVRRGDRARDEGTLANPTRTVIAADQLRLCAQFECSTCGIRFVAGGTLGGGPDAQDAAGGGSGGGDFLFPKPNFGNLSNAR